MVRCPICDREHSPTDASCPHCADEETVVRCERCGQEYAGRDACPACGALRMAVPCEDPAAGEAAGRCVLCGRTVCEQPAPAPDEPYVCTEHRTVPLIGGWAQVYSTTTEWEAQLVRDNLRAEGLEAQIYSQKDHMYPVDFGELAIVRVLVPVWEYGSATNTIREHMDTEGEVVFACPRCGEPYEAGTTDCGSCGTAVAE